MTNFIKASIAALTLTCSLGGIVPEAKAFGFNVPSPATQQQASRGCYGTLYLQENNDVTFAVLNGTRFYYVCSSSGMEVFRVPAADR